MTDRALCVFRDGHLMIDDGGIYRPIDRFRVVLMREHFLQRTREAGGVISPLSAQYARDCQAALNKQDKANSGQVEVSA